ncbi:GNAT family N-acetyltransferase [Haladaptatus cibarius]|uniref:GNAT family N-acetyltransferase n=1 Tax=Haladaptatus cibarius TaxID=453847 RepID=UPI00067876C7|nr:GNAT family N-acetyltransferase [Haladaptatus cibarius]
MRIRRLRATELVRFVDDLWLPFAREMAAMDEFDTLAEHGVRANVFSYIKDRYSDDDIATFVADDGDELVGYVTVEKRASPPVFVRGPRGYIDSLYVVRSRRESGIATRLMLRAESWARRQGCEYLSLDVHADNEIAQSLYRRDEFEIKRHRMTKRL